MVKCLPIIWVDLGSIPGLGRFPWRRKWQPTPVLLPGKFHGLRSLVGFSPWGHKELDTTERLHLSTVIQTWSLGSGRKNDPVNHTYVMKPQ